MGRGTHPPYNSVLRGKMPFRPQFSSIKIILESRILAKLTNAFVDAYFGFLAKIRSVRTYSILYVFTGT